MIGFRGHHIVGISDHPQPSSLGHEEVPSSPEKEEVLGSLELTCEEPKQETLLHPEDPLNPVIQDAPSNSFGFISPILANPNAVHSEGSEPQARDISRPLYFAVSPYSVVLYSYMQPLQKSYSH